MFNYFFIKFGIAYILDLILADPRWLYHPVIIIGKLISFLEKFLYKAKNKIFSGAILNILTLSVTFIVSLFLARTNYVVEIFFLYTTLATKSLANEGNKVYKILKSGDIEKAKKELSYLVSRDTNTLSLDKIIMSVVETIAENTVDGFISPAFYAFVGSFFYIELFGQAVSLALPFAMTYKAINTLDSMVGYKNEKYIDFGKVSARVDDVANFIPARLTGLIFVPLSTLILGYDFKNSLRIFFRDRNKHSSPNSGQSESAYAGALGIQFGGKISYFGKDYEKPTIGDKLKAFDYEDIKKAKSKYIWLGSLLGGPIGMCSFILAIEYTGPAITAIVSSIYPAVGLFFAYIFLKEKRKPYQVVALFIAIAFIIALGFIDEGHTNRSIIGIIFALVCACAWGSEAVLCSYGMKSGEISNLSAICIRQNLSMITYGTLMTLYFIFFLILISFLFLLL